MENAVRPRPVVVGVGGTDGGLAAITLAAAEAGYREVPLVAVTAYHAVSTLGAPAARPVATLRTGDDDRLAAESVLSDQVRAALGERSRDVELRTVQGSAARTLVETAHSLDAQLIVMASRPGTAMLMGTASQYVLRNAPCPVLVVPIGAGEAQP